MAVNDNLRALNNLKASLEHYNVECATNGKEALKKLQSNPVDLIVLDVNMSVADGIEFLKLAQTRIKKQCIPVIVIVAQPDEKKQIEAFQLGCCDFLEKPFNATTLKIKIERLIQIKTHMERLQTEVLQKANELEMALKNAQEQKNYLQSVINSISEGIWLIDFDYTVRLVNKKMCEILGFSSDSIVGKKCFECSTNPSCHTPLCPIERIKKGEDYVEKETIYTKPSGERLWLYKSAVPFKNKSGKLVGVIQTFHDITDRKQVEEELRNTLKELKETQAFVVQQGKLMAIGQMAAGIAHEMNNPLGFVASNFNTLQDYMKDLFTLFKAYKELTEIIENNSKDPKEKIKEIKQLEEEIDLEFISEDIKSLFKDTNEGIKRLMDIIKSLRDFARIDQVEEYSEYDINEGIKSTLILTKNEYKYYAEVKTELGDVPPIYCHPSKINEVFMNIIVNAAQAIKEQNREEKGTIVIKTYQDGNYVYCQISDDGPGIPKEIQDKIFDPFFTTKPPGKGTGLGLNICYDIVVNKHNGQIWVESEPGKGATFFVKLPIRPNLEARR